MARYAVLFCLFLTTAVPGFAQEVAPRGDPFAINVSAGYDAPGGRPGVASDGANFLTVWKDTRNESTHGRDPWAARVTRDGVVLDPNGIRLSTSTRDVQWPSVAFDGTHYLVVWSEPVSPGSLAAEIYGAIVATDGTVVAKDIPITTTGSAYFRVVTIAYDGTNFLIAFRTSIHHIRAIRVKRNGATLTSLDGTGGFTVTSSGGDYYPWVAYGSGQYLVAWHTGRNGWLDIYAARVSTAGTVLDPGGFAVATSLEIKDHVSVAASGSNYLITYRNQGTEDGYRNAPGFAVRVSTSGTVIDTTPIRIADDVHWGSPMPVVFDGTNYVAIYQVLIPQNSRYQDLMGRRISPAGVLIDPTPFPIAPSFHPQGWLPMLAYGNNRFLAVWDDHGRKMYCNPPACLVGQVFDKLNAPLTTESPANFDATNAPDSDAVVAADTGWQSVTSPFAGAIHSVDALDDATAYAGTDNAAQLRYTGGSWQSWSGSYVGIDHALWANAPNDVTAVGFGYGPKNFNGTSWIWTNVDAQRGLAELAQGYWSSGPTNGFIVGTQGLALRFNGTNWVADPTGTKLDLWDVWGTAPDNVYAVGERGTLLHWDGTNWSPIANLPTRQNLNAIWGTSATNIFAVGDFGTILRYDGVQWTPQASGTTKDLTDVAGLSPTAIFAVGFTGTVLRYNGSNWQSETSGTTTNLLDLAVGGNTVWAVGDFGLIRRNVIDASHCTRSLAASALSVPAAGGPSSVNFSTNCAWRTWSNASWIILDSSSNGTGNATVSFTVQANTSASSRTGTLTVGTQTVTVTQAGATTTCTFTVSATGATYGAGAATGNVGVTASNSTCGWSASSNVSWMSVMSGASGTGNGSVSYSVQANTDTSPRAGTLTIAGQTFSVTQSGATPGCTFALDKNAVNHNASASSGNVLVTASPTSCGWTAQSNAAWMLITSGTPGTGNGTVGYSVLANAGTTSRTGTLTIAGHTVTVTQAGLPLTLQPPINLAASVVGNRVTASWTMLPSGIAATGFVVEGGVTPGSVLGSLPTGGTATTFNFNAPTGLFYIRVHALAGGTRSAASNEVRIAVNVPLPPAAPTNLVGEAFGSNLRLSWRNQLHEGTPTGMMLDVSGAVSLSMALPVGENFTFNGVPPGSYVFAVRATNASGSSGKSNNVLLTFPTACVAANTPTNFVAMRSGNVISVSWTPAASGPTPAGYVLNVTGSLTTTIPLTQASISGAVGSGSYTISVTATHPCGNSAPTASQTVVIP